jgi:peptidoglycan/LPS O-acetylase OafA/YrhL
MNTIRKQLTFVPSLKKRIASLDELRGISVILVMIIHGINILYGSFRFNWLAYLGVNIFFVISGYLIATILIQSKKKYDYFRNFYVRRAFRILPLYLLIVTLGFSHRRALFPSQAPSSRSTPRHPHGHKTSWVTAELYTQPFAPSRLRVRPFRKASHQTSSRCPQASTPIRPPRHSHRNPLVLSPYG